MASIFASTFFPASPATGTTSAWSPNNIVIDGRGISPSAPKSAPMAAARIFTRRAQPSPQINGAKLAGMATEEEAESDEMTTSPSSPRTFYNQLPDWSMLLAAVTTVFLAAEKQWTLLEWARPKWPDMISDSFSCFGGLMPDGLVFRQNFPIRSYEIGADRTASIDTMMNHLQDTALNHVRSAGLLRDGFGATPGMSKRNLIWVVSKMQVVVERYPSWGDMVQVDTWVGAAGKNGMRRDWRIRDLNSGEAVVRATSVWVMMNKETRKLSKMPDEVRAEITPYFMEETAVTEEESSTLSQIGKTKSDNVAVSAPYARTGLTPRWSDLDVNQHVNNVKYLGWILESVPTSILEERELSSITLEYRKECGRDSVVQSLTTVLHQHGDDSSPEAVTQCVHLLRLESEVADIVKGSTQWRPKPACSGNHVEAVPADAA